MQIGRVIGTNDVALNGIFVFSSLFRNESDDYYYSISNLLLIIDNFVGKLKKVVASDIKMDESREFSPIKNSIITGSRSAFTVLDEGLYIELVRRGLRSTCNRVARKTRLSGSRLSFIRVTARGINTQ